MHALTATTPILALALGFSSDAWPACTDSNREFVAVQFDANHPLSRVDSERLALERKIVEHLQAEFRPQGIQVCLVGAATSPMALASIQIVRDASNEAFVRASANDAVTQKELSRKLSLDGLPKDAHALAIALGASELLRASWVELRLERQASSDRPIPESVERAVEKAEKPFPSRGTLGVSLAAEAFTGGLEQIGIDTRLSVDLWRGAQTTILLGGRAAISAVSSAHGTISADGWLGALGTGYRIAEPTSGFKLNLLARLDVERVKFSGNGARNAVATSVAGLTSWASTGLGLEIAMSRHVALDAAILAGYVLSPIVATDSGTCVLGASEGLVATSVGIKFPL